MARQTTYRYFAIHKPYGVLSQFTREHPAHSVLGDLYPFPNDVYPIGRLDRDSEGLLLLTNNPQINALLLSPSRGHQRTYWVQVEGAPTAEALRQLREGVDIRAKKRSFRTLPAQVRIIAPRPEVPDRDPPVRYRANIPDTWAEIKLTEGKNRQVRRMWASVGFPVLRLIRASIAGLSISPTDTPGSVRELTEEAFLKALKINRSW